ncbi:MAG TPA: HAD-IA family hydrolase [Candidatus Aquilonibacter sp.]|nr:HAD-IA family hydrolase [Candidatus Aquilonibacter sp.]
MALVTVEVAGVLFDMDGVLVSSIGSVLRSWRRWAKHYGLPNAEKIEIPHGVRAVDIMLQLKPDIDKAEGLKLIEDIEVADTADLEVLAGVRVLLESLPAYHWAIVTSATRRLLLGRLKAAGLPVPDRIISGDQVKKGKPDPEPYRRGAELLGAKAEDCLVVEDAPSGVRAGVAAGCKVLGVLGTHRAEELREAGASWIVSSLKKVRTESSGERIVVRIEAYA